MSISEAPLGVLPDPSLIVGDQRLSSSSAQGFQHVYAATGAATVEVVLAGATEMDAAVRAARAALPVWRALPADQRRNLMLTLARLIEDNADELAVLQTVENGTPMAFSKTAPPTAADLLVYNAGWVDKIGGEVVTTWPAPAFDYTLDEPYGVVAVIIPWNGPLISLGMTLAPALAAGNTIVVKPPELAPFTGLRFGELCLEAGFPPGVVNVVPGGPEGGEALVRHPGVDKIHFTGSGPTAKKILSGAQTNLTPVGLELGGKSANIIFGDADVAKAIEHALQGVFILSGQACALGTRVLVQDSVYDDVVNAIAGIVNATPVGDPLDESTIVGPVISEAAAVRIAGVIADARDAGSGRLVAGGQRVGGDMEKGFFIAPTVFADVDNRSSLAQAEVFGPVLSILRFTDEDDAVAMANDTAYGLAAYVHTEDLRRAHRVSAGLIAGNVWVNGFAGIPGSAPFGGNKQSGYGRLGGIAGIREFSRPKNVWIGM